MLIGTIETMELERIVYPPAILEALDFLKEHDFANMEDGKYPIGDKGSVANLQRYITRPIEECRPETHVVYADIQYIVEGEEELGWCPLSPDLVITQEYDAEKDVTFYERLLPESSVVLFPGSFAVLYPADVHRPCGAIDEPAPVTKVVVKVPVISLP